MTAQDSLNRAGPMIDSLNAAIRENPLAAALIGAGFDRVDYVAIRDAATLVPLRTLDAPARVLAAARVGAIRLIDNRAV